MDTPGLKEPLTAAELAVNEAQIQLAVSMFTEATVLGRATPELIRRVAVANVENLTGADLAVLFAVAISMLAEKAGGQ